MALTRTYETAIYTAGFGAGLQTGVHIADLANRTVSNTVNVERSTHRLAGLAGLFADDPMWSEYLIALRDIRREEDAEEVP
ncbi:MAG TPA: hypothetical protein VGJ48_00130 [Pyrinomonadaceae bacterium]|jgi:hypothetical protein